MASKRRKRASVVRGMPKIMTPGMGRAVPPLRKHQMQDMQKRMRFVMNLNKRKAM